MGTKNNPGAYDCYANADPDEPLFVLLARDKHAPLLVELWAEMRALDGEDPAKVREAYDSAAAMRSFRLKYGILKGSQQPAVPNPAHAAAIKTWQFEALIGAAKMLIRKWRTTGLTVTAAGNIPEMEELNSAICSIYGHEWLKR